MAVLDDLLQLLGGDQGIPPSSADQSPSDTSGIVLPYLQDVLSGRVALRGLQDVNRAFATGDPVALAGTFGGAGMLRKLTQAEALAEIRQAMARGEFPDYGLRVTEEPLPQGRLGPSRIWDNGEPTGGHLPGTSVVHIPSGEEPSILEAFRNAGLGGYGPNGTYFGKHAALVGGERIGAGDDVGEAFLRNAQPLLGFEKGGQGPDAITALLREYGIIR